jgi:hypothetical protein
VFCTGSLLVDSGNLGTILEVSDTNGAFCSTLGLVSFYVMITRDLAIYLITQNITKNTMSTKGLTLSDETRAKISLSKTKYTKTGLVASGMSYLSTILGEDGEILGIPTVVGYCLHVGISRSRLYELIGQMPEVADIVEYIEMLQEQYAIKAGFTSKNSKFAMFLLKSRHNYRDNATNLTQNNNYFQGINPDLLADALTIMNKDKKALKARA